jgi:hypothetical protein
MGKKRRLWVKWGIVLVIIGLGGIQTKGYGESWKWELLLKDVDYDLYYDPDTVTRSPENIVRVWWKEVFKTKEVLKSRGFTRSEYEKAAYQINVTEINCKKKECCRKFFMLCSEEGETIFCTIHRRQLDEWIPMREEHATGVLYLKLCQ